MAKDFDSLLRDAGLTPVPGHNFVTHIPGNQPGDSFTDYDCNTINWGGTIPTNDAGNYSHGATFAMRPTFGEGTRAHYIRTGNVFTISLGSPAPFGFDVVINSQLVTSVQYGANSECNIALHAPYYSSTYVDSATASNGYTLPSPPPGTDPVDVTFYASRTITGTNTPQLCRFYVHFTPGIGSYNPPIQSLFECYMNQRGEDGSSFYYRWFRSNNYTGTAYAGRSHVWAANPGETLEASWQWSTDNASWTNGGTKSFTDQRAPA